MIPLLDIPLQEYLGKEPGVKIGHITPFETDVAKITDDNFLLIFTTHIDWRFIQWSINTYFKILGYKVQKGKLPKGEKGLGYLMKSDLDEVLVRCTRVDKRVVDIIVETKESHPFWKSKEI